MPQCIPAEELPAQATQVNEALRDLKLTAILEPQLSALLASSCSSDQEASAELNTICNVLMSPSEAGLYTDQGPSVT